MYSLKDLLRGIRHPDLVGRELKRLYQPVRHPELLPRLVNSKYLDLHRMYTYQRNGCKYNPRGTDIFEEDWDNLILLDACRFDVFQHACGLDGRHEFRISRGSSSAEFIRGNFLDARRNDVVYVSANGWFGKLRDELNAELHEFVLAERDAFDGLTTHPETLTTLARTTADEFPDKRLIIHYMQPHSPYFTEDGEELFRADSIENLRSPRPPFTQQHPRDEQVEAYRSTLRLVLNHVASLVDNLVGKTVISADHGELLGERVTPFPVPKYDHPGGLYIDELVKVPWFVNEFESRKTVSAEACDTRTEIDTETIDDQLKALGYKV